MTTTSFSGHPILAPRAAGNPKPIVPSPPEVSHWRGAKIGCPEKDVVVISGDGSFQMNMQELATARMYNIPVKIIVFNNGFLGMVRQWQELFYENRFSSSDMDYNPDFAKLCAAFDIPAKRITADHEVEEALDFLLNTKDVCLIEVAIPREEKVYPMVSSGTGYREMVDFDSSKEAGDEVKIIPNEPAARDGYVTRGKK